MTQAKIDGKFYPLQHEEWLRACRELTSAQRDVLFRLVLKRQFLKKASDRLI
jgi:hypothetical protein